MHSSKTKINDTEKRVKEYLREKRIKDINEMTLNKINDEIRLFEET